MIKIALLLSGEMREYKKCYKNLYNFIGSHNDIDVFLTTWDKYGGRIYESKKTFNNNIIDIKDLKKLLKPKIINVLSKKTWNDELSKILKISENVCESNYGVLIQTYLWLITFLEFKKYKIENGITYDIIIRTRPDIFVKNINVDYKLLDINYMYSYYYGCKKSYAKPKYEEIMTNTINKIIIQEHKKFKTNIITDLYLKKLNLYRFKNLIDFNIIDIKKDMQFVNCDSIIDWFNISNFKNIEIQSYSFLIYLLFLQNNKADLFLKGKTNLQNRVNMMFYICSINNIKGKIFPKEFAHIVYNNKQYL